MKPVIENRTKNVRVAGEVKVCRSFWLRMKGLLGTQQLSETAACWIEPCGSVHTIGMAYAVDAYFLDRQGRVVGIEKDLKPNRFSKAYAARAVVEMVSGFFRPVALGDQLVLTKGEG